MADKINIKETYSELASHFKETRSQETFTKLYQKMYPNIFNYVYNMLRDYDLTSDVVADTMVTVYTKIDQYDPSYQITTWAYKIAYNGTIRAMRERNSKVSIGNDSTGDISSVTDIDSLANKNKIISDHMHYDENDFVKLEEEYQRKDDILQEDYESLLEEIKNLKPMYKSIMVDRFLNGMSYEEIVVKMNSPYMDEYNRLQKITDTHRINWENDMSNQEKKKAFMSIRTYKHEFEKKNMVSLQTIKNRIRRARIFLYDKMKDNTAFLIYNKNKYEDEL